MVDTGRRDRRRRNLSRTWAVLVVGWSLVRALVVWATLSDYGVNPWIFLAIDLTSAVIDGYATPRAVVALVDRDHPAARKWLGIAAIAFLAPDLYLLAGGEPLPPIALAVLATVVLTAAVASVVALRRKIRTARVEREALERLS